ncbi:DUF86 domain-containing protein [Moraxella osloensis]|nr:HepT-like ribonuclease domain-containing protein [Moraxella osloensis]QRO14245.1 DUF86 domain-containing protein [Moraxella osloensis]
MNKRMPDYLYKMIEICQHIPLFIEHIPLDDFLNDKRTQNAVAMSLIALGEIANVIYQNDLEFVENNSQISWKYMRGMRNIIAHGYFELDFKIIYQAAERSIPELLLYLKEITN